MTVAEFQKKLSGYREEMPIICRVYHPDGSVHDFDVDLSDQYYPSGDVHLVLKPRLEASGGQCDNDGAD